MLESWYRYDPDRGLLTDKFALSVGRVMIRRGSHRRTKTVEIYGQAASLLARVKELLHS